MSYGYGAAINRALKRHDVSIAAAAEAMGYARPDMLYKILRDDAEPSIDKLQRLADFINEPIGDLLPNSGVGSAEQAEFRDVLAAMSGVAGDDRLDLIGALAVNARVLANAYRRAPRAGVTRASDSRSNDPPGSTDEVLDVAAVARPSDAAK